MSLAILVMLGGFTVVKVFFIYLVVKKSAITIIRQMRIITQVVQKTDHIYRKIVITVWDAQLGIIVLGDRGIAQENKTSSEVVLLDIISTQGQ